jgi:hypothetical protein
LALQFVCATINIVSNINTETLIGGFQQVSFVLVNWELPLLTLSSALWCWHGLLVNYPTLRDQFIEPRLLETVSEILGNKCELSTRFEECPLCPILHCAAVLLQPPHPPSFVETFPYASLCCHALSEQDEVKLLALNVIRVIAQRCAELIPALIQNGLDDALIGAIDGSFAVKLEMCHIATDLMFALDIDLVVAFVQTEIFATVIGCVPQLELGEVKLMLRAIVHGIRRVEKNARIHDVRVVLGEVVREMMEDIETEDQEALDYLEALREIILG